MTNNKIKLLIIATALFGATFQTATAQIEKQDFVPVEISVEAEAVTLTHTFDQSTLESAIDQATAALVEHMDSANKTEFTVVNVIAAESGVRSTGFAITCGKVLCASGASLSAPGTGSVTIRAVAVSALDKPNGQTFKTVEIAKHFGTRELAGSQYASASEAQIFTP